jgi:polysaccharide pyruvyl transferase WcaK-like protein
MKILVFNVKYSENLGDGLLAQCLEKALKARSDNITVETIDIAGRADFGATQRSRQLAINLLQWLPAWARRTVVQRALAPKLAKLMPRWERAMMSADAVVIGGGNLFQDDDLNFPLKIGAVLDCARGSGLPVVVHAVGVGKAWSTPARRLFGKLEDTNLKGVMVRDAGAQANWRSHFKDGPAPRRALDPGLLACDLVTPRYPDHGPYNGTVGICVTSPVILRRHASQKASTIPLKSVKDYRETILEFIAAGYRVRLFCNGAREDQAHLEKIVRGGEMTDLLASGQLVTSLRPIFPAELLDILQSTTVVVAHRLHACIAAYSLARPHVGLGWDGKVSGFFQSVDRSEFYLSGKHVTPASICATALRAHEVGIDSRQRLAIIDEARRSVSAVLDTFGWQDQRQRPVHVRDVVSPSL